ncbi:p24 family protein gamma-4 [Sarotherodon galilaeus]
MLLKVKYQSSKKYIRLQPGFTYLEFISEVKNKFGLPDVTELHIFDETDTAVEEDIFLELIEANPDICLTVCDSAAGDAHSTSSSLTDTMSLSSSDSDLHRDLGIPVTGSRLSTGAKNKPTTEVSESEAAKEMVENALCIKPGGEDVLEEYKSEKSLQHRTRRQLVNILASHMTEMHGRIPSRKQKEKYALGIITLFPSLKDPFSPKGYEHFYDGEKGTGYLAWRLKTMSRSRDRRPEKVATSPQAQGPNRRRSTVTVPQQLDGDACREAVSFLLHCNDETVIFEKMKMTFQHRQNLVHDPQRTTDVLKTFPRFLDIKGLLNQDFQLLFGAETASKLLEKWEIAFKPKIIDEARHLTRSAEVHQLLKAAEKLATNDETNWDSDMASLLLLLHLLPPTAGRKRTKISPCDAVDKMVHFHKSNCSIDEHLRKREGKQPYILAVGRTQNNIHQFYIVVDKHLIPCQATSSLGAFDELFKSHYVFNLSYDESLVQLYTFVQTAIYSIDATTTSGSPRVCELRAKFFN